MTSSMGYRRAIPALCTLLALTCFTAPAQAGRFRQQPAAGPDCDPQVPALTSGYGSDGPYHVTQESLDNPAFTRRPVQVFLPQGAPGKRPVVFFSHGYGPGEWQTYQDLIDHMVSVGDIVVFSSYPMLRASDTERYADLWAGFQATAQTYAARMDLTRVAFVGHSFGGGATPAMAYKGIVQQGWGRQGAFLMELAPWYVFEMSDAELQQFPAGVLQLLEVYDRDDTNDHRMAIDLYDHGRKADEYLLLVHSGSVGGCEITADHSTPGRNASLRQKQYAVFRPFDALADAAFNGSSAARAMLAAPGNSTGSYQALSREDPPAPVQPESYYKYPWSDSTNPRGQEPGGP